MLNGMRVRGFLTGWMILVKTKQSALLIVKGHLAIRFAQNENTGSSKLLLVESQRPVTNLART